MSQKNYLYRHFDSEGNLLYVGISINPFKRLNDHENASCWFEQIKNVTIEKYKDRKSVLEAEKNAIKNENPIYNLIRYKDENKKDQYIKQNKFQKIQESKDRLTKKVIFKTTYSLYELSSELNLSTSIIRNLIETKKLNAIYIGTRKFGASTYKDQFVVTGWQLIEFLEHMENSQNAP